LLRLATLHNKLNEVREKTKLTCSVGISPNKLLSKIASSYKKPDGLTTITPDKISEFMETLNLGDIHGVGKKTVQKLAEEGIETISQAKNLDIFVLISMFGRKTGTYIHNAVRGINDEVVKIRAPTLQLSKIMTLKEDSVDYTFLEKTCLNYVKNYTHLFLRRIRCLDQLGYISHNMIFLVKQDLKC